MSLISLFTDIANAIRAKDGSTGNIAAAAFPQRIRGIQTGTDTSDATAAAADILSGRTAYVNGEKVTGSIPSQAAATIMPGTSAKTAVAAGRYTTGDVKVAGDMNLQPWNIVKNKSVFGVSGSAKTLPALDDPGQTSGNVSEGILSIDVPADTTLIMPSSREIPPTSDNWWIANFYAVLCEDDEWYGVFDSNESSDEDSVPSLQFGPLNWDTVSDDGSLISLEFVIDVSGRCNNGSACFDYFI